MAVNIQTLDTCQRTRIFVEAPQPPRGQGIGPVTYLEMPYTRTTIDGTVYWETVASLGTQAPNGLLPRGFVSGFEVIGMRGVAFPAPLSGDPSRRGVWSMPGV